MAAFLRLVNNDGISERSLQWRKGSSKPRKLDEEITAQRAQELGLRLLHQDETTNTVRPRRVRNPDCWNVFDYSSQNLDQIGPKQITAGQIASIENLAKVCARTLTRLWERDSSIVRDFLEDFINNLDQSSRDFIRSSIEDFKDPQKDAIALTTERPEAMGFENHRYAFFNFIVGVLTELNFDSQTQSKELLETITGSFNNDNSFDHGHSDNIDQPQLMDAVKALAKSLIKFGAHSNRFSNFIGWSHFGKIATAFKKELESLGIEKAAIEVEKLMAKGEEVPDEKLLINYPDRQENLQASEAFHNAVSYLVENLVKTKSNKIETETAAESNTKTTRPKPTGVA